MIPLLLRSFLSLFTVVADVEALLGSSSLPRRDPHVFPGLLQPLPSSPLVLDLLLELFDFSLEDGKLRLMILLHVLLEMRPEPE
jgi:hypothetical protein